VSGAHTHLLRWLLTLCVGDLRVSSLSHSHSCSLTLTVISRWMEKTSSEERKKKRTEVEEKAATKWSSRGKLAARNTYGGGVEKASPREVIESTDSEEDRWVPVVALRTGFFWPRVIILLCAHVWWCSDSAVDICVLEVSAVLLFAETW
jgi:hypothetical protein